jgi:hypothetical protein
MVEFVYDFIYGIKGFVPGLEIQLGFPQGFLDPFAGRLVAKEDVYVSIILEFDRPYRFFDWETLAVLGCVLRLQNKRFFILDLRSEVAPFRDIEFGIDI